MLIRLSMLHSSGKSLDSKSRIHSYGLSSRTFLGTSPLSAFVFTQCRLLPGVVVRLNDYHYCLASADVRTESGGWHGNKGGEMTVDVPGQHVLERTACSISNQAGQHAQQALEALATHPSEHRPFESTCWCRDHLVLTIMRAELGSGVCDSYMQGDIEARFTVALPARGRTILGTWAAQILVNSLPRYAANQNQPHLQDARPNTRTPVCMSPVPVSMAFHMFADLCGCDGSTLMQVRGSRPAVQQPGWGSSQKACGLCGGHTLATL